MANRKKTDRVAEFGDFQTPAELASRACEFLSRDSFQPASLLEPTCGVGSFLLAALEHFPSVRTAIGVDINPEYVDAAKSSLQRVRNSGKSRVMEGDFFNTDWFSVLKALPDPLLVIGNPPWVTNTELSSLRSANLPPKANFKKHAGLDAIGDHCVSGADARECGSYPMPRSCRPGRSLHPQPDIRPRSERMTKAMRSLSLPPFLMIFLAILAIGRSATAELTLDEAPAGAAEWGYRPAEASESTVTPPSFCWRPQKGIDRWELSCQRTDGGKGGEYSVADARMNVHCPPRVFPPGEYSWRYRGIDAAGKTTNWSRSRAFVIPQEAVAMPLPARAELLARIPKSHPRLFVRPEDLTRLRQLAQGPMKEQYEDLVLTCESLLKRPPPTEEPKKYPKDIVRGSDAWRKIWWGNRTYTSNALDGAATLAFTRLLGGKEEYGQAARRILLDCADWDPKGATGYRYNDEAGMPYNYYFSRTYTFVHDLLSEEEREICRRVMKIRGDEMYRHLCPRHLWQPYSSHSNRAWHFLGEMGIAFQDEIEGADEWVWFAMNVFQNVYPVWSDDDGGWHEGTAYWSSYLSRFTWWADVMRSAMDVNAYDKPFFSRVGYYPIYLMPPGKLGGGFGDLTATRTARSNLSLTSVLAAQSGNGHWQWYVEQMGGPQNVSGYVGFVRGALPKVTAAPPDDLPTSRLFEGTGQAYLNSDIRDAEKSVQVAFKSSPFGTQSHGYESNNSFLLWAYGERLLIRTGRRDSYGSDHHRNWMWTTRSVNSITVDGIGQKGHSSGAKGRIVDFKTTPSMDIVTGEAADTYKIKPDDENPDGRLLDRFTRSIVFVKPELVIVYDRLTARRPATFEYWLHATEKFAVSDQRNVELRSGDVVCPIDFMEPSGLTFTQTDQYDPNPRERVKLREWHLTATTEKKSRSVEFVTLMRPHRAGQDVSGKADLQKTNGGYVLTAELSDGQVTVLLPTDDSAVLSSGDLSTKGKIAAKRVAADGSVVGVIEIDN